jgi:hypothetical protein
MAALGQGLELPVDDSFTDPAENPKGYAESVRLTRFNDAILNSLGGSWSNVPELGEGWVEALRSKPGFEPHEALARFRQAFRTDKWVWKDPRNCVLAPYWLAILPHPEGIVVTFRDPEEVAESLSKRGLTRSQSLALWYRHTSSSLANLPDNPGSAVLVVGYHTLMVDRDRWMAMATEFLNRLSIQTDENRARASRTLVDDTLYRNRKSLEGDERIDDCTARCRQLYDVLMEHEGNQNEEGLIRLVREEIPSSD